MTEIKPPQHVELNLDQDSFLAQSYWDDSFNQISDGVYEYTEHGNIESFDSDIDKFYLLKTIDPKKVFQFLWDEQEGVYEKTFNGIREFIRDNGLNESATDAFSEHVNNNYSFDDLNGALETLLNEVGAEENFIKIITRGYSQGDYAEVYVKKDSYEKLTGKPIDEETESQLQTEISHLFWDSPIYAQLEIDDDTIYLTEYLDSSYDWDRDKILTKIKDQVHPSVFQFLNEHLPEDIDYEHQSITMEIDEYIENPNQDKQAA